MNQRLYISLIYQRKQAASSQIIRGQNILRTLDCFERFWSADVCFAQVWLSVMFYFSFRHCEGVLPAHTVEGLREDLRRHAVLVLQDQALLQGHRHGRAVFGAFAAGEANPVQPATDLTRRGEEILKLGTVGLTLQYQIIVGINSIELFHLQLFDHIKISTSVLRTVWYIIFNSLCNRAGTSPRPPARGCPRSCFSWRGRSAPETSAAQGDKSETETLGGLRGCKKEQSMKNNAFICRVF